MDPILELKQVSKHFGAIHAVTEIGPTLDSGEAPGLMGDNGAGKSTLVKGIAGNFPPSNGEIRISGERETSHSSASWRSAWPRSS